MAVLMTAEVLGQTQQGYDGMLMSLEAPLRQAKGFIAHMAAPSSDGWTVFEIWESEADATDFFAKFVHPNLPEGVKPKRSIQKLHSLIRA